MIQFNLLPDVKLAFIKAKRIERSVMFISFALTAISVVVLLLLFVFTAAQKKHITDLNKDVKKYSTQLKNTNNLDKVLTIQNQLNSLTALHDQKPVTTRLFNYITSLTPAAASISKFNIDFTAHTISITGTADSLSTVNQFVDTLKFTTYRIVQQTTDVKAFSNTVLSNFTRDDKATTYQIDSIYDPLIFDSKTELALTVPQIISTRSETEKPTALFQQAETTKK
jgi:Tfp pilus assembly protein PilN